MRVYQITISLYFCVDFLFSKNRLIWSCSACSALCSNALLPAPPPFTETPSMLGRPRNLFVLLFFAVSQKLWERVNEIFSFQTLISHRYVCCFADQKCERWDKELQFQAHAQCARSFAVQRYHRRPQLRYIFWCLFLGTSFLTRPFVVAIFKSL